MTPHEKAQGGLSLLKEAILEVLANHPEGLQNAQIADLLGLRSDYKGANKDYLSWSVLGLLFNAGRIERKGRTYVVSQSSAFDCGPWLLLGGPTEVGPFPLHSRENCSVGRGRCGKDKDHFGFARGRHFDRGARFGRRIVLLRSG